MNSRDLHQVGFYLALAGAGFFVAALIKGASERAQMARDEATWLRAQLQTVGVYRAVVADFPPPAPDKNEIQANAAG